MEVGILVVVKNVIDCHLSRVVIEMDYMAC